MRKTKSRGSLLGLLIRKDDNYIVWAKAYDNATPTQVAGRAKTAVTSSYSLTHETKLRIEVLDFGQDRKPVLTLDGFVFRSGSRRNFVPDSVLIGPGSIDGDAPAL